MSPRFKIPRRVIKSPKIQIFVPAHSQVGEQEEQPVFMFYEEYEALRLCEYDKLTQLEASKHMGISRPTFTRIHSSALQKVAKALVETRPLKFVEGAGYFETDWYQCLGCGCYFSNIMKPQTPGKCSVCGSSEIMPAADSFNPDKDLDENELLCPYCGFQENFDALPRKNRKYRCKHCGKALENL